MSDVKLLVWKIETFIKMLDKLNPAQQQALDEVRAALARVKEDEQ